MTKKKKSEQKPVTSGKKRPWVFSFGSMSVEKAFFAENLSMLLGAGMNIVTSLNSIAEDLKNKKMKYIVEDMRDAVESGVPVSKAIETANLFPEHIVSLIKIGESSGTLNENLKLIADKQEKDRILTSRIRTAMIYPVFVIFLTFIIGLGIAWFVLPRFVGVFKSLNVKLPLLTRILIWLGDFFVNYGAIAVPLIIGSATLTLYLCFFNRKTKYIGQFLIFSVPLTRRLIVEVEQARFGYILGTLMKAGLPILEALEALRTASSVYLYRRFYQYLEDEVKDGQTFSQVFKSYKKSRTLFPLSVQQIIIAGEQSGRLSDVAERIGEIYEFKTETTAKNLSVLLEPVILVVIGLCVLGVALAIITPIYGLLGSF